METSYAGTKASLLIIPEDSLYLQKPGSIMKTNRISVFIPKGDMPFFRKLSRKMGWAYTDGTSLDESAEALKSIEQGFNELKSARDNNQTLPGIDQLFDELKAV
ncbi:MAG: hypothetical protein J5769_06450 [Bacteroidales bacterium]|nr:hypothetical protein [Bacteroidales bacterium]